MEDHSWRCSRPSKRLGCRRPSSCPASRHASPFGQDQGGCRYRNRTAPVATISRKSPTCSPRRPSASGRPEARGCPDSSADAATICSWCAASSVTARHTPCIRRGTRLPTIDNLPPLGQQQAATLGKLRQLALCHGQPMDFRRTIPGAVERKGNPCAFRARQTMPRPGSPHQAHTPLINCTIAITRDARTASPPVHEFGCHDGLPPRCAPTERQPTLNPFYFYNAFMGHARVASPAIPNRLRRANRRGLD